MQVLKIVIGFVVYREYFIPRSQRHGEWNINQWLFPTSLEELTGKGRARVCVGGEELSSSLPGGAEPSKLLYPGSTGKEGGASSSRIWTGAPVCSSPFLRTKKPGLKEKQMRRLSQLKGSFQSPAIGRKGLGSFPNTSYLWVSGFTTDLYSLV